MEGFSGIFSQLEDPRTGNARRHDLCEVLVIALCSCLLRRDNVHGDGGVRGGQGAVPAGVPDAEERIAVARHVQRLFRLLDPAAFGACFSEFMRAFSRQTAGVVAVDAFKPGQPWMSCSQSTSSQTTALRVSMRPRPIGAVRRTREPKGVNTGPLTAETAYYLLSEPITPERLTSTPATTGASKTASTGCSTST